MPLRKSMAEKRLKRKRTEPKVLQIEKDAEAFKEDSSEVENITPLETWQFKPRKNKNVCQYCGYFSRTVGNVNKHVKTMHEMTTWYKCKLCHLSFVRLDAINDHLRVTHYTIEEKFETINNEKEILPLRKLLRSIYSSYIFVHIYSSRSSSYRNIITCLLANMSHEQFSYLISELRL